MGRVRRHDIIVGGVGSLGVGFEASETPFPECCLLPACCWRYEISAALAPCLCPTNMDSNPLEPLPSPSFIGHGVFITAIGKSLRYQTSCSLTPGDSPVSNFHLTGRMLGLQTSAVLSSPCLVSGNPNSGCQALLALCLILLLKPGSPCVL